MSYSKIFEVKGETAQDFIDLIEENGPEDLMSIISNTVNEWDEQSVFEDISLDDMDDSYSDGNYTMVWEKHTPVVQFYMDGHGEETASLNEEVEEHEAAQEIVDEALGDQFLYDSLKSLQDGDKKDFERYISNRIKNMIKETIN